jgi:hypothetical protein
MIIGHSLNPLTGQSVSRQEEELLKKCKGVIAFWDVLQYIF